MTQRRKRNPQLLVQRLPSCLSLLFNLKFILPAAKLLDDEVTSSPYLRLLFLSGEPTWKFFFSKTGA